MGKGLALTAVAVAATFAATGAAARQSSSPLPLIGVNYDWVAQQNCDLTNRGIVASGGHTLIAQQLDAMREAGIQTLRLLVWNMHDATGQQWGVVSSAGGRISGLPASNLVDFLRLVRADGFKRLEVAFGPEWSSDPIDPSNPWDPSLFDENWKFIKYTRALVKQYGPATTRFDLINEGAPSDFQSTKARVESYIAQMYTNYVTAYGNADVTVSSIVDAGDQTRIANLVDTLRTTGLPLPTWYEIHAYSDQPLQALQQTDATLTAKGITAPISLGESYYDDADTADAVASFVSSSSRRVLEALTWPLARGASCSGVSAPYSANRLYDALTGADHPNPALTLGSTLTTADGHTVLGLEAGTYQLVVNAPNALVIGPGVYARASATVRLQPGLYLYRVDGQTRSFRVF